MIGTYQFNAWALVVGINWVANREPDLILIVADSSQRSMFENGSNSGAMLIRYT